MYFWIEAIHAGAWECLPKPVEEAELNAVLLRSINA
jgi:FixJ family two-component response regulator